MATAKQKQNTQYNVTLQIDGTKLETMAAAAKKIGVEVRGVEKVVIAGEGEWGTEWVEREGWMNPVLVNTDGRFIQRFEDYDDNDQPIEGKYAYYTTRDACGKEIGKRDTLDEAKALIVHPVTQADLMKYADDIAAHVVKYGGGNNDEAGRVEGDADRYLMGRNLEVPEQEFAEDQDHRRTPEYIVTLRIKASTLPAIEKKAKAAFGDKLKSVEKVGRGFSRADDLDQAEEHIEAAKQIVGELKDDMGNWRDNMPEALQGGDKYSEVEECASNLESLMDELENISMDNVEFPSMF